MKRVRTMKSLLKKYPLAMFYEENGTYCIFTSTWREVWQQGLFIGMRPRTRLKMLVKKRGKDKILSSNFSTMPLAWDDAIQKHG